VISLVAHYCSKDNGMLNKLGMMSVCGCEAEVYICPWCGEITFWEKPKERKVKQQKLVAELVANG